MCHYCDDATKTGDMAKDLISVSILVSEHLRLSLNNGFGGVFFEFFHELSPHRALMIAQRLASEPVIAVRSSISLFLSLFLCAAERGIMEAVCPGGGEPFVVRNSTESVASLWECVCVCVTVFLCVRMKTRWHWREGRADWSQQGEASGIITGSVRSGDAMSPYLHRHRTLCLPLSHGPSRSRSGEAGWAAVSRADLMILVCSAGGHLACGPITRARSLKGSTKTARGRPLKIYPWLVNKSKDWRLTSCWSDRWQVTKKYIFWPIRLSSFLIVCSLKSKSTYYCFNKIMIYIIFTYLHWLPVKNQKYFKILLLAFISYYL